jgi:hypothetical protein
MNARLKRMSSLAAGMIVAALIAAFLLVYHKWADLDPAPVSGEFWSGQDSPVQLEPQREALTAKTEGGSATDGAGLTPTAEQTGTNVTNTAPVPPPRIVFGPEDWAEYNQARRRELAAKGIAQDIATREALLKERCKGLQKGMTISEAIEFMGIPTAVYTTCRVSPGLRASVIIRGDELPRCTNDVECLLYSPYEDNAFIWKERPPPYPFHVISLRFGPSGDLESWGPP